MRRLFQVESTIDSGKTREVVLKEYALPNAPREGNDSVHLLGEIAGPFSGFSRLVSSRGLGLPTSENFPIGTVLLVTIEPLDAEIQPSIRGTEKTVVESLRDS